MPSSSENQRRLFGMALAYKRGELKDASDAVKQLAKTLDVGTISDFARKDEIDLEEQGLDEDEQFLREVEVELEKLFNNE